MRGTRATGVEFVKHGQRRPGHGRARGDPRGRRLQHAATADAVGHRPGRASARDSASRSLADLPVGKNLQDHLASQFYFTRPDPGPFRDEMRFDRMAREHDPRLSVRHRSRHRGAGRAARLHQDAARARGAGHRVHVPRSAGRRASVVPGHPARLSGRLRHPADAAASRQPRRDPVALDRPARADAHHLQLLLGAGRSADPARRRQARARRRLSQRRSTRSAARSWRPGPSVKTDAEIDAWIRKVSITAHHPAGTCPMGTGPRGGGRSASCACAASRRCAWSMPPRCPTWCRRTSTPACIMMAEKASDMIRGRPALAPILDA